MWNNTFTMLMLISLLFLGACVSDKTTGTSTEKPSEGYVIRGTLTNAPVKTKVFLDDLQKGRNGVIDTATIAADGTFEMRGKIKEPIIAQFRAGLGKVFIILDNETMDFTLDYPKSPRAPVQYTIKGSPANDSWQEVYGKLLRQEATLPYMKQVIDTSQSILLSYLVINQIKPEDAPETYNKFATQINKQMPGSKFAADIQSKMKAATALAAVGVGKAAPNINLPSPDGQQMSLADLKGQVVLLDFWASWCRPCRKENPNVVRAYDKYKAKGFTVFSVSLDQDRGDGRGKQKWEKAIADDNLKWEYHVSDLKGWKSSASALYGVKSIPQTFLIDAEGRIVAKNLRGAALETKLAELLGSA